MTTIPQKTIAQQVRELAQKQGVTYQQTVHDKWAAKINELSDNEGELDATEKLILALYRAGVLTSQDADKMMFQHVKET